MTTATLTGLKPLVEETLAIINEGPAVDQSRVQRLLASMANAVEDGLAISRTDGADFADAVAELREHVFLIPRGSTSETERAKYITDMASKIADSLKWPPVMPQISVIINLASALLRSGVRIKMDSKYEADFDFTPYPVFDDSVNSRNGWAAFYFVFGSIIREA